MHARTPACALPLSFAPVRHWLSPFGFFNFFFFFSGLAVPSLLSSYAEGIPICCCSTCSPCEAAVSQVRCADFRNSHA